MKRITSVLIAVLLGAFTTGIGVVPFLVLANQDRAKLSSELKQTQQHAEQVEAEKEQIADHANKKVEEANIEIQRAQQLLEQMQEDQRLISDAQRLEPTPSRELYGWETVLSLYQEVTFSIPSNSVVLSDSKKALVVQSEDAKTATDARWLSISPYDSQQKAELLQAMGTSTAVSYLVDDVLLTGRVGELADGGEFLILEARQNATSSHLIWLNDPGTLGRGNGFERLLGTLRFNRK
ncbi:hypothetical protein GF380_05220 [Candidatus Uhrbacteria bacterium]|nr:hypothetical protein [Candidatus Uhrbacteria bacterium]MBD3284432.1 hypothetical protein [Candidatus Uhrbacteria bacterium]